jgi:GPH family glycoside/pentoside/hexuronide:cation symporter
LYIFLVLTKKQKFVYGFARFGSTIFMGLYDFASFYIYWQVFQLDPALAGVMGAAGKTTIMIASYIIGFISDSMWTRLGRRKPFILSGAPLLAFSGFLHFTPIYFLKTIDQASLFWWGTGTSVLFHIFYAWLLTPYQAWLPEISEPQERIDVSMIQNLSNILGHVVSTVTSFLVKMLVAIGLLMPVMGVYALILVALFTPQVFLLPVEKRTEVLKPSLKDFLTVFRYPEYVKWMGVRGLMSASVQMLSISIVAYIEHVIGVEPSLASASFGVMLVVFVAGAFPLWGRLGKTRGKGYALSLSLIILAITLLLTLVPHFVGKGLVRTILGYLIVAVGATALSAYVLFPYAILADLAHWYQVRTGENRAGLFTGFEGIPINIFESLAYLVTGTLMKLPSINGYSAGLILWGPVGALFTVLALLVLKKTNVDPFLSQSR